MSRAIEQIRAAPRSAPMGPACPQRVITVVEFDSKGVTVQYLVPAEDLKANGVALTHQIFIPLADEYDDEIDAVVEAALSLVADVLEDLPVLAAQQFGLASDDEEEE